PADLPAVHRLGVRADGHHAGAGALVRREPARHLRRRRDPCPAGRAAGRHGHLGRPSLVRRHPARRLGGRGVRLPPARLLTARPPGPVASRTGGLSRTCCGASISSTLRNTLERRSRPSDPQGASATGRVASRTGGLSRTCCGASISSTLRNTLERRSRPSDPQGASATGRVAPWTGGLSRTCCGASISSTLRNALGRTWPWESRPPTTWRPLP